MRLRRSIKSGLALVLCTVLAVGIVGGIASVKSYADTINHDYTVVVNIGDTVQYDVYQGQEGGDCRQPDSQFDASWMTSTIIGTTSFNARLVFSPTAAVAPGTYTLHYAGDYENDGDTHNTYLHVIVREKDAAAPASSEPNPEDRLPAGLPERSPDGHQHSWEWAYGSTYHCSICNTFYTVYPAHDHQYEWYVTKPATETDDGEAHHMCKICGSVDLIEPVGAYYLFSQNAENKINKAPIGGTVNVETTRWLSFQGYVLDALAKRPDVTLNVTFRENGYKGGEVKTVTIPAGYDAASLKDANGYCGFKYLAGIFGAN